MWPPSFLITLPRWSLPVVSLMPSSKAIRLLSRPCNRAEYLPLTRCEGGQPLHMLLDGPCRCSLRSIPCDQGSHRIEQGLVPHGFSKKSMAPHLHRAHVHRNVAMPHKKDDAL